MATKRKVLNAKHQPHAKHQLPQLARGGFRPGSGRKPRTDKTHWGQITCILKKDTIEALRAGAASKHFGEFLQFHLDRYPLPRREIYLALLRRQPITVRISRRRKVPVLISMGDLPTRRLRRARTPLSRAEYDETIAAVGS